MTLPHPYSFSNFEVEGHGSELGTCSSCASCLSRVQEDAKLEVGASTGLIYYDYREVASTNAIALAWDGVEDTRVALFSEEDKANIEDAKELIYCTFEDKERGETSTRVNDLAEGETSLNVFLVWHFLRFIPKTIIR